MYKQSKWAKEIIDKQDKDGLWGYFHTLSEPNKYPITTEQALRRLCILGYTIDDEPIEKTVLYMNDCLLGKKQMPDRREKTHNWDIFTELMLSTWIRKFTKDNTQANKIADKWAKVISASFLDGKYNHQKYINTYELNFGIKPYGGRLIDFVSFYQVSLIADCFIEKTESMLFDYILNHNNGIYYIYDHPIGEAQISVLPESFNSKKASKYIGAIEVLASYRRNIYKLQFVIDWLENNKNENGEWDMGSSVKDFIYFPLSDGWNKESREIDCTYRINVLLNSIRNT
ncbi:MAG: hypothetical protein A2Y17_04745 [Clostridiales bacterium GWF2_38_85]|nr:MAG: hypothetical protein A2Y17_04745 [Clostridiales bacterium GWF2_38_85]HBL84404.1 hypothetical protein [Clostridiales bacterium]